MQVPKTSDIPHKVALYKLLSELLSDRMISTQIYFKGGTCAAMLGWLDRFSVDLDFDLKASADKKILRKKIHNIIKKLDYSVKDESKNHLQFFIKYRDIENSRNTLKLEISDLAPNNNIYETNYLIEIDKHAKTQSKETMFANKLVALKARFEEGKSIAGRDIYDIAHFFKQGFSINKEVIKESRGVTLNEYTLELIEFINQKITQKLLQEDLNTLLTPDQFKQIPYLKMEVVTALSSVN